MGITPVMWSRAGSNGWGSAEQRAIIGRNEGARVKEEVGNDAGDARRLLEPSPAHVEGPDSSGSLTSYLPAASICSAVAEDGGRRQNRAAY